MSQPEHNAPFHDDANQLPAGPLFEIVGAGLARDGLEEFNRGQGPLPQGDCEATADGHAAPPAPNGTGDTARLRPAWLLPAGVKLLLKVGLGALLI
ncbi:MAG: hypothetical protein A3H44_15460 [Gammaproteobacteria bacterium RIFCSPLOWO2_02_FULL_57_10]|nr:MAG: hypothetical protein A3H44_15460 [Gammaproteobacteria bacterium RIFCSPLOWO2_02_FULL_57_10]